jgi:hypothetical protein
MSSKKRLLLVLTVALTIQARNIAPTPTDSAALVSDCSEQLTVRAGSALYNLTYGIRTKP